MVCVILQAAGSVSLAEERVFNPFSFIIEKILPSGADDDSTRITKIVILSSLGIILLMILIASISFWKVFTGAEKVVIPKVENLYITDALIKLQEKELYPKVQPRFSLSASEKGKILEQDPPAGTFAKAGQRIMLAVSQGTRGTIADYIGKDLSRALIDEQNSLNGELTIERPIIYVRNKAARGTIISQDPPAGTEGKDNIKLVVSKGPEQQISQEVPKLTGLSAEETIGLLAEKNIAFEFNLNGKGRNRVIAQNPGAGAKIFLDESVKIDFSYPTQKNDDYIFDLFEYDLPLYPVLVDLKAEAILPDGKVILIFETKHLGGKISFPYRLKSGTILQLSVFNKTITSIKIQNPEAEINS